jgi:hypothetical protein
MKSDESAPECKTMSCLVLRNPMRSQAEVRMAFLIGPHIRSETDLPSGFLKIKS